MAKCAIIADDLTGANATGVLLAQNGLKMVTVVNYQTIKQMNFAAFDGVVINTFSRGIAKDEARRRVQETTSVLLSAGIKYFSKRIDSTIRGNLGAEIEGVLSALGREYVAIVVPAYPRSGRIVVGGYLLVNSIPVEQTDAGRDPKTPVYSSETLTVISQQTPLPSSLIPLNTVLKGREAIKRGIKQELAAGKRIIVFDAINDTDIANIATAVKESGIKAVAVDPGPLTQALLTKWLEIEQGKNKGKVMIVASSATSLTRLQLDYLQKKCKAQFINIDVKGLLDKGLKPEDELYFARKVFALSKETDIFGLRVAEKKEMIIDLEAESVTRGVNIDILAERITSIIARIACKVLTFGIPDLKGVYLTGGDMTVAFCQATGAQAIELRGEVLPLASYGVLVGGKFAGLPVVTKGGLVGTVDGALKCIQYLLNKGA